MRWRWGVLAAMLALAGGLAGGSLARPYLERGDVAKATPSHTGGANGSDASGSQGQAPADGSSATDPNSSAKKGKGYCVRDSDGDKDTCPAKPKKAAKKGKGFETG
jgi:hypothetical protein